MEWVGTNYYRRRLVAALRYLSKVNFIKAPACVSSQDETHNSTQVIMGVTPPQPRHPELGRFN